MKNIWDTNKKIWSTGRSPNNMTYMRIRRLKDWKIRRLAAVLALLLVIGCSGQMDMTLSPQDEQSLRIQQLIKDLDDNSQKTRIKATEELIEIGEPALEQVKKALAKPPSNEVRIRAGEILKKIEHKIRFRYSQFKGGDVVCGLQATLRCEKDTYKVGEPITFEYEIKNVDTQAREFVPIKGFNNVIPGEGLIFKSSQAEIAISKVFAEGEKRFGGRKNLFGFDSEPDRTPMKLNVGERVTKEIAANYVYESVKRNSRNSVIPSGEYKVIVVYFAKEEKLLPDAPDDLKTNVIRFNVEEK